LKLFETHASSEEEKGRIRSIKIDELINKHTTIIDLFKHFPSVKIPLSVLFNKLSTIFPWAYTIASSAKENPNSLQIAISLTPNGLTSEYLKTAKEG